MNGRYGAKLQVTWTTFSLSIFHPLHLILRIPWMHDHWVSCKKRWSKSFRYFRTWSSGQPRPFETTVTGCQSWRWHITLSAATSTQASPLLFHGTLSSALQGGTQLASAPNLCHDDHGEHLKALRLAAARTAAEARKCADCRARTTVAWTSAIWSFCSFEQVRKLSGCYGWCAPFKEYIFFSDASSDVIAADLVAQVCTGNYFKWSWHISADEFLHKIAGPA